MNGGRSSVSFWLNASTKCWNEAALRTCGLGAFTAGGKRKNAGRGSRRASRQPARNQKDQRGWHLDFEYKSLHMIN